MTRIVRAVAAGLALLCSSLAFAQTIAVAKNWHAWWDDAYLSEHYKGADAKNMPLISVRGNRFVDPQGKPVLFRGLSISDPDKIANQGHWNREHFVKVKDMGANLVRIPVHPIAWRERTPRAYLALLDQAVGWCTELGIYVDIDWHSIGNLKAGMFQDPMYETSMAETFTFWRTISQHYAGTNTVAFYELFNEPTLYRNQLGRISWDEWKKINEDLIATIRAFDHQGIPLVAGFDWAYDLTPLRINPIEASNIGYVTHPYPMKRTPPWEPKWEEDFGFAADEYPVLATEIGFTEGKGGMADNGAYGVAIIRYLEGRGIGWLVWVFDPDWGQTLYRSWDDYKLTEGGEFFKKAMQANNAK